MSAFSCGSLVRITALGRTAVSPLAKTVIKSSLPLLVKVASEGLELSEDFFLNFSTVLNVSIMLSLNLSLGKMEYFAERQN